MTKANSPGYLIPENLTPDENICICVPVPKDWRHINAFLGQIAELGYWYTWERDTAKNGRVAAGVWREIFDCINEEINCVMTGCGCGGDTLPNYTRINPVTGEYEVSNDGIIWTPAPYADPRVSGITFPPVPGTDGSEKKCAAANSVTTWFETAQETEKEQLDANASVAEAITALIGILATAGFIFAAVPAVILALVAFVVNTFAHMIPADFEAQFTSEKFDDFFCIVFCEMADNASFTEVSVEAVKTRAINEIGGYAGNWFADHVNLLGVVGMTNLARSSAGGSRACGGCECGCSEGCELELLTYQYNATEWTSHGAYTRYDADTPIGEFDSFTLEGTTAVLNMGTARCIKQVNVVLNCGCPFPTGAAVTLTINGISRGAQNPIDREGCGDASITWDIPAGVESDEISLVQTGTPCVGGYDDLLICVKIGVCV